MLSLSSSAATLKQGREADVPMTLNDISTWVPYYSTNVVASEPTTIIASIFAPLGAFAPTNTHLIVDKENYRVSFTTRGKVESVSFSESAITPSQPNE
jgi:hypothetical protein